MCVHIFMQENQSAVRGGLTAWNHTAHRVANCCLIKVTESLPITNTVDHIFIDEHLSIRNIFLKDFFQDVLKGDTNFLQFIIISKYLYFCLSQTF